MSFSLFDQLRVFVLKQVYKVPGQAFSSEHVTYKTVLSTCAQHGWIFCCKIEKVCKWNPQEFRRTGDLIYNKVIMQEKIHKYAYKRL